MWILVSVLFLIVVALILRIINYKKQLHSFTKQIHNLRTEKKDGLISVDNFDEDYINLAKELQQYVDEGHELIEQSEKDRQSVKHMVAGISHDFRTPLTAAMGYIQLAEKDEGLSVENAENLKKAYDKTKYLKELSDEFFALSLMENRPEEELTEISFKRLLENVTLEQYEWIGKTDIKFEADITDDSCMIRAAEVDMTRLLMNLYSNAKKYAKSSIKVSLKKGESDLILVIENDMDKDTVIDERRVFEPFHREYVGEQGGNGLGLYITKRIVENYGGKIMAEKRADIFSVKVFL
ncbi:Signal transduction histidine kinase [Lachnospiraceae bacterium]|nr:Signal transduction histidine kinase [Lachnospiraceae bacterium]